MGILSKNKKNTAAEGYGENKGGMFLFLPPELAAEFYDPKAMKAREELNSQFHVTINARNTNPKTDKKQPAWTFL